MKCLKSLILLSLIGILHLNLTSCSIESSSSNDKDSTQTGTGSISVNMGSESRSIYVDNLSYADVKVYSSDFEAITLSNVEVVGGVASFTVDGIPFGNNRIIEIQAKSSTTKNVSGYMISCVFDMTESSQSLSVKWSTSIKAYVYAKAYEKGIDISSLTDEEEELLESLIPGVKNVVLLDTDLLVSDYISLSKGEEIETHDYVLETGSVTFSLENNSDVKVLVTDPISSTMTNVEKGTTTVENVAPGQWRLIITLSDGTELYNKKVTVEEGEDLSLGTLDATSDNNGDDSGDSGDSGNGETDSGDNSSSYNATGSFVALYLNDLTFSSDGTSKASITTKKQTVKENVTVKYESDLDNIILINAKDATSDEDIYLYGTYKGSGIKIQTNGTNLINLYLNDVSITSSNYPCIEITKGSQANVILNGTNTMVDGRSYGTGYSEAEGTDFYSSSFSGDKAEDAELTTKWALGSNSKGTLFNKGDMVFSGNGSLTITEAYKHCIASKSIITINGGSFNLNSTGRNGIQTTRGFIMNDGTVNIKGSGTNTNNESRGIIVEGEEDSANTDNGWIKINGGTIISETYGKGIAAKWEAEDDAETSSTSDDPDPSVYITGGYVKVTTTGSRIESNQGGGFGWSSSSSSSSFTDADGVTVSETISRSPEGIEGKKNVVISGGEIILNTTDDCINSSTTGNYVEISGGKIFMQASGADAIDSNGNIKITGGIIIGSAMMGSENFLDCGDGGYSTTITGGYIGGISGSTNSFSSSNQSVFTTTSVSCGSNICVKDSNDNVVYALTVPSNTNSGSSSSSSFGGMMGSSSGNFIMTSPSFSTGETYTLYTGVTFSGGENFNGFYTTLPTVTGGTSSGTLSSSGNGGSGSGSNPGTGSWSGGGFWGGR